MATILPECFLRKTVKKIIFGHLASGRGPKVATSDGHNFARMFPEKNYQKNNFWPNGLRAGPQFCQNVS
jgi:hypothetical protein